MTTWLDNASSAYPRPREVSRAVARWCRDEGGNPRRPDHSHARHAASRIERTRAALARFIGAADPSRLCFVQNATDGLNGAIFGVLARRHGRVICGPLEHNSVTRPLTHAIRQGLCSGVDVLDLDADFRLQPRALEEAIDERTALVVIGHVSNVLGVAQDVAALARVCREREVPLLVDAAQSVGLLDIDVEAWGVDMLAFSGHKGLYGPTGAGGLYVDASVDLSPWRVGGTGGFRSDLDAQPLEMPWRLEAGTLNDLSIAGLEAGLEFVRRRGAARLRNHALRLARRLLTHLAAMNGVVVYNRAPDVGIVSFNVGNWPPLEVVRVLDETFGCVVGGGLSCSPHAHRYIGTQEEGAVRVSVGWFNHEADIDRLVEALERLAEVDIHVEV